MIEVAVVLDGALQSSDGEISDSVLFAVLPIFVLLVGGLFWYVEARKPIQRALQFLGMQSFEPHADAEGLVAIRGTVRATDGTVTAPLSETDCVAYDRSSQAYRHGFKYDRAERRRLKRKGIDEDLVDRNGYSWETTGSTSDSVPFHVETEHGPVAVDPTGAKTVLPEKVDRKSSILHRIFYIVHPFTGRANMIFGLLMRLPGAKHLTPSSPSREVEKHLEPGEEVVVVADGDGLTAPGGGDPVPGESNAVGVVTDGEDVDRFRVTTRSPLRLKLRSVGSAIRSSITGLATLFLAGVIVVAGVVTGAYV